MSIENLTAYMQDHAAGASAALDLLDHLISSHADTPDEDFFKELLAEIKEDKARLEEILGRFDSGESVVRNTVSRLGEKFARVKFLVAGHGHGDLGRLEALEMVSLGIEGKRVLWLALEAAAIPELQSADLPALASRAADQRERVEKRRLLAARKALATA
jgi:hypothetical protein